MCPKYAGQGVYSGVHVTPPPPTLKLILLTPLVFSFSKHNGTSGSQGRKLNVNKLPMRKDEMKITEPLALEDQVICIVT